jgi:hypothetical protein
MSESEKQDQKSEEQNRVKSELNDIRSDVIDVKESLTENQQDAKRQTKKAVDNNKWLILFGFVGLAIVLYLFAPEAYSVITNPPEILLVVIVGIGLGIAFGWIPANYLANRFVKDDRKPLLVLDPDDFSDFAVWDIPVERVHEIEVKEGEKRTIETKKGTGYEVENFKKIVNPDTQKEHLVAKAPWTGEKSGLEIRKNEAEITAQRNEWKPLVKAYYAYEVAWPYIVNQVEKSVVSQFTREFQEGINYNGVEIRQTINQTVEDYKPQKMKNKVEGKNIEEIDAEELSEEEWANMTRNGH